jgi:hypothetical protein
MAETAAPPWGDAVEALKDFLTAKSATKKAAKLAKLVEVIRTGASASKSQREIWAELREIGQERCRMAAQEHKREIDLKSLIPAADAVMFVEALGDAVKQLVQDQELRNRLYAKTLEFLPPVNRRGHVVENEDTDFSQE